MAKQCRTTARVSNDDLQIALARIEERLDNHITHLAKELDTIHKEIEHLAVGQKALLQNRTGDWRTVALLALGWLFTLGIFIGQQLVR